MCVHVNWDQIPARQSQPGVTTRRFDSDGNTIFQYNFEPHAVFPVHSHPEEQVVIVLTGRATCTVDGTPVDLKPGDIARIGPNVPHGVTAGPEPVQVLNLLSPRRTSDTIVYQK